MSTAQPGLPPAYTATATTFTVHTTSFPERHPRLHRAIMAWCEFHGIDPREVPMCSSLIRDVAARCVRYERIVRDDEGRHVYDDGVLQSRPAVAQGETSPFPFPVEASLPRFGEWKPVLGCSDDTCITEDHPS